MFKIRKRWQFIALFSALTVVMSTSAAEGPRNDELAEIDTGRYISSPQMSENGRWAAYSEVRSSGESVAIKIDGLNSEVRYNLPDAREGAFSKDGRLYAFLKKNYVGMLDLKTGRQQLFSGTKFSFTSDSKILLIQQPTQQGDYSEAQSLQMVPTAGGESITIPNISSYEVSHDGSRVAYIRAASGGQSIELIDLQRPQSSVVLASLDNAIANNLTWSKAGDSIAFASEKKIGDQATVTAYFIKNVGFGEANGRNEIYSTHLISSDLRLLTGHLRITPDDQALIMDAEYVPKQATKPGDDSTSGVEVWHYRDAEVVSEKKRSPKSRVTVAWHPVENRVVTLTEPGESYELLIQNGRQAIVLDDKPFLPRFKFTESFAKVYLVDVATGVREEAIDKQLTEAPSLISVSPSGEKLLYYEERAWFSFDVLSGKRQRVATSVDSPLVSAQVNGTGLRPYGVAGWTKGEEQVVIYDEYDLWLVDVNGLSARRLTQGRDYGRTFRVYGFASPKVVSEGSVLDLANDLVLNVFSSADKASGISIRHADGSIRTLLPEQGLTTLVAASGDASEYLFTQTKYNAPLQLSAVDSTSGRVKHLARNSQYRPGYESRRAELVSYTTSWGEKLQGSLFFPRDFKEGKKYPMVVSIYQKQTSNQNVYPTHPGNLTEPVGEFTENGYFVLLPDIGYLDDEPGKSALECVTKAVRAVMDMGYVDFKAVGLMGHSFGGYETAYIISQTDLFAAAIAGAAPMDLVSYYLSIAELSGSPALFRFESQQWRFSRPMHESYDEYVANSPLHHATSIRTPLLTYSGDRDTQVPWTQSMEMFNLMRRMGKNNVFLLYPGEGHLIMTNPNNQQDLLRRGMAWFDHYLKGIPAESWIANGTN